VAETRAPERVAPGVYLADAVGFPNAISVPLLEWSPEAELGTTEHEAGIVSGRRGLDERPNRIVRSLDRRLQLSPTPVDEVLREGYLIPGFRVILAPGHTSGPASLLRDEYGRLFAGDPFGAVALRRPRVGVARSFARSHHWQSLRREAAPGGVRHRGHEPRQVPAHRRPPIA
jgi:glyoxylase-like metal-dependent hydrolase (beta-lactamase superfamily II)